VLLLKPTLHLFPCQAFPLEGSPGLDEGSPLLVELVLYLLTCGPLLPELLLRRRKRRGLLGHARPQLLCLLGLLLGLALPSTRSLEGRVVLLKLGTNRGHLSLPLHRQSARLRQVFPRPLQRLSRSTSAVHTFSTAEAPSVV
jgi:hypothetical protein